MDDDGEPISKLTRGGRKKKFTFSTMRQKQREQLYFASPATNRIHLPGGSFVDFTAHFKYLGSYASFDLTDDYDIEMRIITANNAMGALRHFWNNPYADLKAKHSIFQAIPLNLLFWGCESWALRKSHIRKLDVFIHRSIRRIMGIGMQQVHDERIRNERVRKIFFNIPDAESQLTIRQMTYIGKLTRTPEDHPPKQLLPAWVNKPRPRGGVLTTNKKAIVRSLAKLLPDEMEEIKFVKDEKTGEMRAKKGFESNGSFVRWTHIAQDEKTWNWHIEKLKQPGVPIPPPRPSREPPPTTPEDEEPETNQHQAPPPQSPPRRRRRRRNNPPPSPPPARNRSNNPPPGPNRDNNSAPRFNPEGVGSNKLDSLGALGLRRGATEREVRSAFRRLSLKYHPDRYSPTLGITLEESTAHFQMLNNAHEHLRSMTL